MFSLSTTKMPDIVIIAGNTDSAAINYEELYMDAEAITIFAPAVLAELATFQVSEDAIVWNDYNDLTNTAVKMPTAGKAITYNGVLTAVRYWRIHLGGAAAVDHTFLVMKVWRG